jgi:hypothetical protein
MAPLSLHRYADATSSLNLARSRIAPGSMVDMHVARAGFMATCDDVAHDPITGRG